MNNPSFLFDLCTSQLIQVSKVEVVPDLMHLARFICALIITVHGIPAVDSSICDSTHSIRRETIHDVVGMITGWNAEDIIELSQNGIAHYAVSFRITYRRQVDSKHPV